jgi:glyoxylase-like metal-dependent hydrolase (beta-lactamase superfamily II)
MRVSFPLLVTTAAIVSALSWSGIGAEAQSRAQDTGVVNVFPVQGDVSVLIPPGGPSRETANITVQTSEGAIVLVDSGRSNASEQTLAAIRRISPKPVRFIINTQAAPDHTGGNEALAKSGRPYGGRASGAGFLLADQSAGATIIAHESVLLALSGARGGEAASFGMLPTETYFTKEHELFNGEAIQLFHEPAAYTDGDSVVFFRRSDVISTGDIFSTLSYPRFDIRAGGTIDGVIDALNHVIDLAIPRDKQEGGTYIVPGHGRVADEADVVEYRDMVTIIRDRVQDLLTRGRSVAQSKAAAVSFDYDRRYATSDWTADQFVDAVVATLRPAAAAPSRAPQPRRR